MFSSEGFWLFQGPRDHSDYNVHGTIFGNTLDNGCFPTKNIAYHSKYKGVPSSTVTVDRERVTHNTIFGTESELHNGTFMFPDESFMRIAMNLGFNRNDGILSLMPLVCYVHDE